MAYERKTKDVYTIEGNYGYGWDRVCDEETRTDAWKTLKEYRMNEGYCATFRMRKHRVKK